MSSKLTRNARRTVSLLAFALVVQVFVLPQIGGARNALSVLGSVDPLLLVAAVALDGASFLAYARMTQVLLPAEHRPGLGLAFGTVMASTGVNHVVPGGAATTAAVNYRLLGGSGVPASSLGFALGTQAVVSAVVLNVILWMALVVSIPTSGFQPIYGTAAAVGAILISLFSGAVVALVRGREGVADRVAGILARVPKVEAGAVRSSMLRLADQMAMLLGDRRRLKTVVGLAAANWLLDAAALWVTLMAFGHRPGLVGLIVAYGLANVMAAVPVSPGGLGVIEAVLIPSLVGFGTPSAVASIGVVAYRLVNFWLPIPVGAVSYVTVQRLNAVENRRGFRDEVNEQISGRRGGATASSPEDWTSDD